MYCFATMFWSHVDKVKYALIQTQKVALVSETPQCYYEVHYEIFRVYSSEAILGLVLKNLDSPFNFLKASLPHIYFVFLHRILGLIRNEEQNELSNVEHSILCFP